MSVHLIINAYSIRASVARGIAAYLLLKVEAGLFARNFLLRRNRVKRISNDILPMNHFVE